MINVWSVSKILEDSEILTPEETKKATPFCVAACAEMSKRLKDIKDEDCYSIIVACAGIALYNYMLLCGCAEEFSSFKAGDVTIKQSYGLRLESAAKFRDEALLQAAPYLIDVDFAFEAVEI